MELISDKIILEYIIQKQFGPLIPSQAEWKSVEILKEERLCCSTRTTLNQKAVRGLEYMGTADRPVAKAISCVDTKQYSRLKSALFYVALQTAWIGDAAIA